MRCERARGRPRGWGYSLFPLHASLAHDSGFLDCWRRLSPLPDVQSVHACLVTGAHLLFQDLPDLEDVDTGESLEDQDKAVTQVFPNQHNFPFHFRSCRLQSISP